MARWEPDTRRRLVRSALDLFIEQGYDNTTVVQIAERAGLTKSTFFRHFTDKREVLDAGQDTLCQLLADGITNAPATASPIEAIEKALEAVAVAFTPDVRELGRQLQAVIAANGELQDRDALKRTSLAAAMTDALERRGVAETTASLASEFGVLALRRAHARWSNPSNEQSFGVLAQRSLRDLRAASATLT